MTGQLEDYQMLSVSVVITPEPDARFNTEHMTPEILEERQIVPFDWSYSRFRQREAALSSIQYKNSLIWEVRPRGLLIEQRIDEPPHSLKEDYQVHTLAERYLRSFSETAYGPFGLNCIISLPVEDPTAFLIERFFPWLVDEGVKVVPNFFLSIGEGTCKIECSPGSVTVGGEENPCVLFDANTEFPPASTIDKMVEQLNRWKDVESRIITTIDTLLREKK